MRLCAGQVQRYTFGGAVPRLLREGGVAALWHGNTSYMLRHVPSTTLSFTLTDALLRRLPHFDAGKDLPAAAAVNILAGGLGGAAALALVYPLDFATIRHARGAVPWRSAGGRRGGWRPV
jgi:solute carrier family 25 (adenine nucleotide translocator) protein 4/5/6/31